MLSVSKEKKYVYTIEFYRVVNGIKDFHGIIVIAESDNIAIKMARHKLHDLVKKDKMHRLIKIPVAKVEDYQIGKIDKIEYEKSEFYRLMKGAKERGAE